MKKIILCILFFIMSPTDAMQENVGKKRKKIIKIRPKAIVIAKAEAQKTCAADNYVNFKAVKSMEALWYNCLMEQKEFFKNLSVKDMEHDFRLTEAITLEGIILENIDNRELFLHTPWGLKHLKSLQLPLENFTTADIDNLQKCVKRAFDEFLKLLEVKPLERKEISQKCMSDTYAIMRAGDMFLMNPQRNIFSQPNNKARSKWNLLQRRYDLDLWDQHNKLVVKQDAEAQLYDLV